MWFSYGLPIGVVLSLILGLFFWFSTLYVLGVDALASWCADARLPESRPGREGLRVWLYSLDKGAIPGSG
jgi:hypothetical protein